MVKQLKLLPVDVIGTDPNTANNIAYNGILFEAKDAAEAAEIRQRLLPIAQQINHHC